MTIFAEMMNLDPAEYLRRAEAHLKERNWGEAKIEYEKSLELLPRTDAGQIEEIRGKIELCCNNLALLREEWGDACLENGEYEKAIEEFSFGLSLLPESSAYRRGLLRKLNEARRLFYKNLSREEAAPAIERGEAFLAAREFDSALVEFREALAALRFHPADADPKRTVLARLATVEEEVVRPYLDRGKGLSATNLFDEAITEFEAARAIAQNNEAVARQIDRMLLETMRKRGTGAQTDDTETFISRAEWDAALGKYQTLLDNYFRFSQESSDPYQAVHINPFEQELHQAKRLVGGLYIRRADGFLNLGRPAVALKYYAEAQNFFDEHEPESAYLTDRVGECKKRL